MAFPVIPHDTSPVHVRLTERIKTIQVRIGTRPKDDTTKHHLIDGHTRVSSKLAQVLDRDLFCRHISSE